MCVLFSLGFVKNESFVTEDMQPKVKKKEKRRKSFELKTCPNRAYCLKHIRDVSA